MNVYDWHVQVGPKGSGKHAQKNIDLTYVHYFRHFIYHLDASVCKSKTFEGEVNWRFGRNVSTMGGFRSTGQG